MGGRKDNSDADRFLLTKRDIYYYQRKVPLGVRGVDERAPVVRISLKTKRIAEARVRRDAYEEADNQLWGAMTAGDDQQRAIRTYQAAVKRAEGFPHFREREELAPASINKYMRNNGLMPTPKHTLYGLRHSLEDRMKKCGS